VKLPACVLKHLALAALALGPASPAAAATISVAVAANFTATAERLAEVYRAKTGDEPVLSFGSTGALFAQIVQGAPYEVLLAADDKVPQRAIDEGFAVPGSMFTYAIGKLVLYSNSREVSDGRAVLEAGQFEKLALADPAVAPYGAAAMETLASLGLEQTLAAKFVTGGNVSQALQFVESGNAELGFVALSQVLGKDQDLVWIVPAELYGPIRQNAVLLRAGQSNEAASAFLNFLKSPEAVAIIEQGGYAVEE
jgi:molybdate transport system substrate-binding protein